MVSIKESKDRDIEIISKAMNPLEEFQPAKEIREKFKQEFENAEKTGNLHLQSYILGNWGLFELMHNELEDAKTYFQSAIKLDLEINDQIALGIDKANLGTVYYIEKNYDASKSSFEYALTIQLKNSQWDAVFKDFDNLIRICKCSNSSKQARQFLKQAEDVFGKIGDIEKINKLQKLFEELWPSTPDIEYESNGISAVIKRVIKKLQTFFEELWSSKPVIENESNGISALFERAKKVRSVEACNNVRLAIVELGNKERDWQANLLVAQGLQYIVREVMLLSLEIGNKYKDTDPIKAQEFWAIALSVSNDLRCLQMGVMKMLKGPVGKNIRHRWPNSGDRIPFVQTVLKSSESSRALKRGIRSDIFENYFDWVSYMPKDSGEVIYTEDKFIINPSRPSLKNFLVVTYSFLKDDLVIFIDTKLSEYIYKDKFADYAYTPDKILPTPYACPPIHIKNVKPSIIEAVEDLFDNNGRIDFDSKLKRLSILLAIPTIDEAISHWCQQKGFAENDMQLIFIPEGILHRVPFGFLRTSISTKSKLFDKFASVTTALSSLALKWQIQTYIYRCLPFIEEDVPRCVFFGAPKSSFAPDINYLPGIIKEWELIRSTFGPDRVLAFGDETNSQLLASIENLATYHNDGDIFWYAGHGMTENEKRVDDKTGLEVSPRMALVLPNQLLTLESFYRGKPWNFSRNWMITLNSCFLGQLTVKGTELEGFLSALYLTGANAVVSCLWPVDDGLAPVFAQEFCERLKESYYDKMILKNYFVRAIAFTECMRSLMEKYDEKYLACYFYCGAP